MSRFADIARLERYSFGPCDCPGTPHDEDFAMYRVQLGSSAMARIGRAALEGATRLDPFASHRQLVLESVTSWNFLWLDPDGAPDDPNRKVIPVPINESTVELLDESIRPFAEAIDKAMSPPPNASGAPSPVSPRGSASKTQSKTQKPGT